MPPLPRSSRISSPWKVWPALRGSASGGAVGSVDFWAKPAMHLEHRSPEYRLPQVEHFFIVFMSPACIRSLPPFRLHEVPSFLRRRKEGSSGKGGEQFSELLVHLALPL